MLNAFTAAQVTDLGEQRLADNVVGAALVVIAALVTLVGSRLMEAGHHGDATTDPPQASPA